MIDLPPEPPFLQEQIIEQRLIACGLEVGGFSVRYEDYLQSIEIVIRRTAGASPDHFECIKNAARYEIVRFEDPEMYRTYSDYETELARPQLLESAKSSLRGRGLLEGFPERRNFETLGAYANALEMHGGVIPGSALRVSGDGILFDPPRDAANPVALLGHYSNLVTIIAYASLLENIRFGFLGNEAVSGN